MSKPYRPSNSYEGEVFMEQYCYQCARYDDRDGCPIINASMAFSINEAGYPHQLQIHNESSWCTDYIHQNGSMSPDIEYLDQPDPTAAARAAAQEEAGQIRLIE